MTFAAWPAFRPLCAAGIVNVAIAMFINGTVHVAVETSNEITKYVDFINITATLYTGLWRRLPWRCYLSFLQYWPIAISQCGIHGPILQSWHIISHLLIITIIHFVMWTGCRCGNRVLDSPFTVIERWQFDYAMGRLPPSMLPHSTVSNTHNLMPRYG